MHHFVNRMHHFIRPQSVTLIAEYGDETVCYEFDDYTYVDMDFDLDRWERKYTMSIEYAGVLVTRRQNGSDYKPKHAKKES